MSCPAFAELGACQEDVSHGNRREADGAHRSLLATQEVSMCRICVPYPQPAERYLFASVPAQARRPRLQSGFELPEFIVAV